MIAFTDQQLKSILAAAEYISSRWRNRFLETIADAFVDKEPDDNSVQAAIADAGLRMHINLAGCSSGLSTTPCCEEGP